MKYLLLFLLASVAQAGTASLTGTVPTQNTDGSLITGTITYSVYKGAAGQAVKPLMVSGLSTPVYTAANLPGGTTQCFNMTASVNGAESAYSNEVCKLIPSPIPNPPVLSVTAVTAYQPVPALNKYNLVVVGTVKNGTPCIGSQDVNGLHAVNRLAVKWSGAARPQVVVAQCG